MEEVVAVLVTVIAIGVLK
jgi:hypothetical protein